ncbi:NTP transferase domain-containing protein [Lysinibacillus sp. NPDC097287]|uniref:phosphocholine cytidylyltransferase family protein n=1 Tax=Lysinibacillus sp. NPDC097287 TaxID=3364144 RepID=UPI0037FE86D5
MKTAVIVAAGLSSRLYPLTEQTPKCLLSLGKEKILERNLRILKANGIEKVLIVTGFKKHLIENVIEDRDTVKTVFNPYYKYCNNMGSLYAVKETLNAEPFLYLHGDVVFTEELMTEFITKINVKADIDLAVDFKPTDEEAMKVRINSNKQLIESDKEIPLHESAGEWIGLAAINNPKVVFEYIEDALVDEKLTVYDTYAFTKMANDGREIRCLSIDEQNWVEIDFIEDYEKAKEMFVNE